MKPLQQWLNHLALEHTPDFTECVKQLGKLFPLLKSLETTEQDPEWHVEGNVAIHTNKVLASLYQLLATEATHIVGERRQTLILAAILHDIGKPLTTKRKEIKGKERVVAPQHEQVGVGYLIPRIIELPIAYSVIHAVLGLVGYHQIPKRLVIDSAPYSTYLSLALNADLELLYWLERADMMGRDCTDLTKQLEFIELFKLFSQEHQLFGLDNLPTQKAKDENANKAENNNMENTVFSDNISPLLTNLKIKATQEEQLYLDNATIHQLAMGQISTPEEAIAKTYQAAQNYSNLYLMCGASGSGKSTWIAKHQLEQSSKSKNGQELVIISLDEIRKEVNGKRQCQKNIGKVLQLARTRLKAALAAKQDVIWDATNIRREYRESICDLGFQYGALITIVAFQLNIKTLLKQNRNRHYAADEKVIHNQLAKLQWPSVTEAHRMLTIGEKGEVLWQQGCFLPSQ